MKIFSMLALAAFGVLAFAADADIQKQKVAAGELKKALIGELKTKMSDGSVSAVEFCSKNAILITDSVAKKHGLNIKRVSEKNRNSKNVPDDGDKKALAQFADTIAKNKKPQESLVVDGRYYEPLMTNEMCVVCHGKSSDMPKELKDKINQLYPGDRATGYGIGELRGAIVVW
jgi:hypothetical protein